MSRSSILPFTWIFLRLVILLNWLGGAAILALLIAMVVVPQWAMKALGIAPASDIPAMLPGLRAIAVLGLVAVPLNHAVLSRLLPMIETVRHGDPFIGANALRLRTIAWALLALQLLSIAIGAIGRALSTPGHPLHLDAGFSINGWLAVLLTFVLARVFAAGTLMREDLEGMI